MTTAQEVLNIAKKEIGYRVNRGQASKYGIWYGELGFDTAAWCAMFVSWCFEKAGMPLPPIQNSKGFAYCPYGVSYFKNKRQFYRTPQIGDIVFFDWGGDRISDHVGLVEEIYPTYLKTIEGNTSITNQSNGGGVMRRTRYYPSCLGFARPDYEERSIDWNGFYLELTSPFTRRREVGIVQTLLCDRGFDIKIDNIYGPITFNAVKEFQKQNGLEVDGVVGPVTWQKLHL